MDKILTIYKLENKLMDKNNKSKYSKFVDYFSFVFIFLISGFISYYLTIYLAVLGEVDVLYHLVSFQIFIVQIILFFYIFSYQQKSLFLNTDKMLLSFLPLPKWKMYLGKMIYCLKRVYLLNISIIIPVLFNIGSLYEFSNSFYFFGILTVLFIPLIPFFVATMLSIPFMYVKNFLKNKSLLSLIIGILLTVGLFYLYNNIVFNSARIIILEDGGSGNIICDITNVFKLNLWPSTWCALMMLKESTIINMCLFIGVSLVLLFISFVFGGYTYKYIFNRALVEKNVAKIIKTKTEQRSVFSAYFIKELKTLYRSANYSYTYFGMASAMPLMVLFSNKFLLQFVVDKVGNDMIFGTSLLVILIFISIICSPSACFISREGSNCWILKTNPNGIKMPLYAKSLVGIIISIVGIITTLILSVLYGYISIIQGIIILLISVIYIFGLVSCGLLLNLKNPNVFRLNKEHNSNMLYLLLISLFASMSVGIFSILCTFILNIKIVILCCVGFMVLFTTLFVVLLLTNYKRLYINMEI